MRISLCMYVERGAQSSSQSLYLVSFFYMQIIRHLPGLTWRFVSYLYSHGRFPRGIRLRATSFLIRLFRLRFSPSHSYQIPRRDVHLSYSAVGSFSFLPFFPRGPRGCIFDALPRPITFQRFSSSSVFGGWWNMAGFFVSRDKRLEKLWRTMSCIPSGPRNINRRVVFTAVENGILII